MRTLLTCAAILACAACQQATAPAEAADTSAELKAIEAVESGQIKAIGQHDLSGATALYADDAVFIGDDGTATRGKEAISAGFKEFLNDPTRKIEYTAGPKTFSSSGDLAYSTAAYSETYTDKKTNKQMTMKGTNLSVWKKQADGDWKLVADSNPAASSEVTE
jgi:uncharacterized protein (TIGR02246 family)